MTRPGISKMLPPSLLMAASFMSSTLITPLYALYRNEFHFSELTLTLIYATYAAGNLAALLFFGRLSDQIGRKRVALPAIALACGSTLLFLFAGGTVWLFAARLLSGFAVGLASGTGTAWLADVYGKSQQARATLAAVGANLAGGALGPLLAGVFAQYAPLPLQLSFYVYIAMLVGIAVAISRARESIGRPQDDLREVRVGPQVAVPREIRGDFIAPAVTAFGGFALGGFYFALLPGVLSRDLGVTNLATSGAIVCGMLAVSLAVTAIARDAKSEHSMVAGLVLFVPSVAVLVLAESLKSMPILLFASALVGTALGLGYRGSLQVVNQLAPDDRRAAVVSAYFIVIFTGNSVPIIGIGIVSALSTALTAHVTFACMIAAFAAAAVTMRVGPRYLGRPQPVLSKRTTE